MASNNEEDDMEALEAIYGRRSIRRYSSQAIEERIIETLLRAAMQAPSARNTQPWHFIVVTERKTLDAIPEIHPYAAMLREAPAAVLVCGDTGLEQSIGYLSLNCAAATQNLLLAAHALGLGAVWLGIYPREQRVEGMRKLLGIPAHVIPMALISLGYPQEDKKPVDRYLPQRVQRERWLSPVV